MPYNQELAERVRIVLLDYPGCVEKKLFGGIGFILNGNMACGVLGNDLIVRVGPENDQAALSRPFVRPFMGVPGRPMAGWVAVEAGGSADDQDLQSWVALGYKFASSLPKKP
jgi:TfoX/Sxy family transcriptional regulator of competence genes